MLTHSESKLILQLCIDSPPGFLMSVMHLRIKMSPFMKESVSFHHHIIWTGLKVLTPMYLSIDIMVHFIFNV